MPRQADPRGRGITSTALILPVDASPEQTSAHDDVRVHVSHAAGGEQPAEVGRVNPVERNHISGRPANQAGQSHLALGSTDHLRQAFAGTVTGARVSAARASRTVTRPSVRSTATRPPASGVIPGIRRPNLCPASACPGDHRTMLVRHRSAARRSPAAPRRAVLPSPRRRRSPRQRQAGRIRDTRRAVGLHQRADLVDLRLFEGHRHPCELPYRKHPAGRFSRVDRSA